MGIELAKALQYCTPFTTDKKNPVFGYACVNGDKIYATDTFAIIECQLNGDNGKKLIPLSKDALHLRGNTDGREVPNYERCFGDNNSYWGTFTVENDTGLKTVFRLWKAAFGMCKKLSPKGQMPRCMLESSKEGFYAYARDEKGMGVKFQLADETLCIIEHCYKARGIFNADFMAKICTVLIDLDPVTVTFRIGEDFKKLLVETDDVRILLMGMTPNGELDPLVGFYKMEKRHE